MSLLDAYMDKCYRVIAVVSDAPSVRWEKGAPFMAAILFGSHGLLAQETEEPDRLRCSVTVGEDVRLEYGEMFLREQDQMLYRVLSGADETRTPPGSGLRLQQYRAEQYMSGGEVR